MNIGKNGKESDLGNQSMRTPESFKTHSCPALNMGLKEGVMADKVRILSILTQVLRRISFMKQMEIDEDFKSKNCMEFVNFWSSAKLKVTIEVLDYEEEISTRESTERLEKSGTCAYPSEH